MKKVIAAFGLVVLAAGAALAEGECDKYTTPYDRTYCMGKLFIESDKELNVVYKELKATVKQDLKKPLTETQREWIKFRDNACQDQPGAINVNCNYQVNKERTEYLRDRLREVKTGTPRPEMIVKKSWK